MRSKVIRKYLFLVFGSIFVIANLNLFVFAQPEKEKPRIKDFGSSLKSQKSAKKAKAKTKNDKADEEDVLRVETTLVVSDILVLDKKGVAVGGLKKEDFIIAEDGKPQQIETLSLGDGTAVPRSIVLIIDYSGSLKPYIKTSVEAAKVLVDKLKPDDRMAIVTDDIELLTDFTQDKELLKKKLESLKGNFLSGKSGRSEQFSALYAVLNEMFTEEDIRPIIIFQTDGDEIGRLKGNGYQPPPVNRNFPAGSFDLSERDFSLNDILSAAEKARTTIYTIYPGVRLMGFSEAEQLARAKKDSEIRFNNNPYYANSEIILKNFAANLLKRQLILAGIAKYTGGWADFLESPEQADEVYTRILSGIESRYVIGYYPTNEEKDGKRRVVKIKVRNHPEYIIWGRKTYFAQETEK